MNNEIGFYIHNILKKQLQKIKISNYGLYNILNNVNDQLSSIIYNWNDLDFRKTVLVIGSEEGLFYEPKINEDINNMVVVCIRNSLLETIASVEYSIFGLTRPIDDSYIIEITRSAIEYFNDINLEELSKKIEIENDYYRNIFNKYPVAYKSLMNLSKCNSNNTEIEFNCKKNNVFELDELDIESDKYEFKNFENGISENFNDSLIYLLKQIKNKESKIFFVNSFKHLTRNINKLLKILEFILTNDAYFLTNNYLITNSYVSRRSEIIKSAHTEKELFSNISTIYLVSKKYKDELLELSKIYINNDNKE